MIAIIWSSLYAFFALQSTDSESSNLSYKKIRPSCFARSFFSLHSKRIDENSYESVEQTRRSLQWVIGSSWKSVEQLGEELSPGTLEKCENELRKATSLLVLATVRRCADLYPHSSKDVVQKMLIEADQNKDGQLSYTEWFEWLSPDPSFSEYAYNRYREDPMVSALEDVLRHSVCTLRIVSRMTDDPLVLCAAYVAGGIVAGVLDVTELAPSESTRVSVTRSMLARLSPPTRELVVFALALESASTFDATILRPHPPPVRSSSSFLLPENVSAWRGDAFRRSRNSESTVVRRPSSATLNTFIPQSRAESAAPKSPPSLSSQTIRTTSLSSAILKAEGVSLPVADMRRPRYLSQLRSSHSASFVWSMNSSASKPPSYSPGRANITKVARNVDQNSEEKETDIDILLKLDVELASIPILSAPRIEEEDARQPPSPSESFAANPHSKAYLDNDEGSYLKAKITTAGTISQIEAEVVLPLPSEDERLLALSEVGSNRNDRADLRSAAGGGELGLVFRGIVEKDSMSYGSLSGQTASSDEGFDRSSARLEADNLNRLLSQVSVIMDEAVQLRGTIQDLSDSEAGKMRALLVQKSNQRKDVLGLAMALRSCKLLNIQATRRNYEVLQGYNPSNNAFLGRKMNLAARQQLALETLQLWSPLSFQLGLSSQIPELEVYSYVHLFPKSFGSFISWYSLFRPLARQLIRCFREDIENVLPRDPLVVAYCAKVTIQSRLKTAPSAFKKMLKGAKLKSQLFDILGVRVIITERRADSPERSDAKRKGDKQSDAHFSSSVIDIDDKGDREVRNEIHKQVSRVVTSQNAEYEAIQRVYDLIAGLLNWEEDKSRFKDYVSSPKSSGYQSIHTSLKHKETGIYVEVQIRSDRMHRVAEYGSASHSNYKALLLGDGKKMADS